MVRDTEIMRVTYRSRSVFDSILVTCMCKGVKMKQKLWQLDIPLPQRMQRMQRMHPQRHGNRCTHDVWQCRNHICRIDILKHVPDARLVRCVAMTCASKELLFLQLRVRKSRCWLAHAITTSVQFHGARRRSHWAAVFLVCNKC